MTTEPLLRWHPWALALPALAAGWIGVLAAVMLFGGSAPAALVPLPSRAFLNALPEGTSIVSRSPVSVTLAGSGPGLARALYRAGALIVLPAGLAGCSAV